MEYIGMVDQILAAEHSAKALAEEERRRREQVQSGLEGEIGALRENYLQQARRRVELVEQTEQAAAREQIAQLEERQKTAAARVEEVYGKNRDKWAETLFRMIAGTGS